ncbi:MAG: 5-methyltetrahydropteroyltriglutamate--homocysteine S-methyltransferase [Neisseriaceae bacterium]|nr:MAG: 5-methyltetrahydropteroyltriglutamate--homocysteine S-methyltransferase [Neisseriaceae bacterium]
MNTTHITGFPRVGAKRELKFSLEKFWKGDIPETEVFQVAKEIRRKNRALQKQAKIDLIPVGDFSYYDHVLDAQILVGAIPERFGFDVTQLNLQQYSELARGNKSQPAIEMTKWFDTNYHYLVPEWKSDTQFQPVTTELIRQIREAKEEGYEFKPTIIGPLSLLWLGKAKGEVFDRLTLLPKLIDTYEQILRELINEGTSWIHIDEPILAVDLEDSWIQAFEPTYKALANTSTKIIIGTYFDSVAEHVDLLKSLPIHGLHIDLIRAPEQINVFLNNWPSNKILSLGIIDGRNIWKADLSKIYNFLKPIQEKLGNQLWISTSCSLLHTPQDLSVEEKLDVELKEWLAFSVQKVQELGILKQALAHGKEAVKTVFEQYDKAANSRKNSKYIHKQEVKSRLQNLTPDADKRKSPFLQRFEAQQKVLNIPLLPTTTIGSFPQTKEIRQTRAKFKQGELSQKDYVAAMKKEIEFVVRAQEKLDLDVLVHGEPERNDMVEYFAEQLDGYAFTQFGWVQSYGSRCVKPPIIYGDIVRPKPMTVEWSSYAQSLTSRPMKGMLTGPVTMLQWSFVRNDIDRSEVAKQIALALNDEVLDLERAGIKVIQIDEPAYREGLPLKRKNWDTYLDWASHSFRLSCSHVKNETQIHTHMCYSEFNDILPAIAAMDADVITIETSRSDMELLDAFVQFEYPNNIGPGVYDIHSPRVPTNSEIHHLIQKALEVIPAKHLWINPDCGLKTRNWEETNIALKTMVDEAKKFRNQL